MSFAFRGVWPLAALLVVCGCSSDASSTGKTTGAGGEATVSANGDAGQPATSGDRCHDGCVDTLAAACSNGPADQASCESTCKALGAGKCGALYATLQACAEGQPVTCSAQGLPIVAACSDEQAAFVACING